MRIEILFFGQLTDSTKCSSLYLESVGTTDELKEIIFEQFPELASVKFVLALNSKLAFMSPFSGG
jgi:molybdopterin synthase sulfur carrier subunit